MRFKCCLLTCVFLFTAGSLYAQRMDSVDRQQNIADSLFVELKAVGPMDDPLATSLQKNFTEVSTWISKAAEMVPAEKYSFKATPQVRSFGQLIAHVTDSYNFFCARAAGKEVKWADPVEKGTIDKTTLVPKLKEATDSCNGVYKTSTKVDDLITNIGHTSLHYGNMITYLRLMGMVPPSS